MVTKHFNEHYTKESSNKFCDAVCMHTILCWDDQEYSSAALYRDGSVITWGKDLCGSARKHLLSGVSCLRTASGAFAAIKEDGRIITWGRPDYHKASNLLLQPSATMGAVCLVSTERAFAAILDNGAVIAWGDPDFGGDANRVSKELQSGVIKLCSNQMAIAAIKDDGSVCTWGHGRCGGRGSSKARSQAFLKTDVIDVTATHCAFAALKQD
eukprot:6121125-Karenia_brevis.AAC.1